MRPNSCVPLTPSGGPYPGPEEPGRTRLVVPSLGGVVRFDAQVAPGTQYDVELVAYGEPDAAGRSRVVALGRAGRVTFEGDVLVTLHPVTGWTCPGGRDAVVRRAFHETVLLSNGDALIMGGVVVPDAGLSLVSGVPSAGLVDASESVVVFDAREQRFFPVSVPPGMVSRQLSRAMFRVRWVGRDRARGTETIRLFGGVTGTSTLVFSSSSTADDPVRVSGAERAEVVDVVYDPSTRSIVSVISRGNPGEVLLESPRSAEPPAADEAFGALIGELPEQVSSFGEARLEVRVVAPLSTPRRGVTLSRAGDAAFLVYGGNRMQTGSARRDANLEVLSPTGTPLMVPPLTELRAALGESTLHTASVIDETRVLFVGGLALVDRMSPMGPVTGVGPPDFPVVRAVRRVSVSGGISFELLEAGGTAETATERIYHTANVFDGDGLTDPNAVVVVGGSTRNADNVQFQALGSAYVVDLDRTPAQQSLPSLASPRFGHSAVVLRGGRLLVTGGLARGAGSGSISLFHAVHPELFVVRRFDEPIACDEPPSNADGSRDAGR